MKSNTKVQLSNTDIQKLVDHAFGDRSVSSIREMADGWFNTTYHIGFGDGGQQTVLKVGPPVDARILTYEKEILRAEVETMKLAATNPKIPVPCITFDDLSRSHLPYQYYFMDFIDSPTWNSIHASLSSEQNNLIECQLGQVTAEINAFTHHSFGYYAHGQEFDNWPDAFRWMCELLFSDARCYNISLELSEQEFFDRFEEHHAIFEEVARPQLVHWDLWAGNIFISVDKDDTPRIKGLVDFERSLWGDPLMESYLASPRPVPNYMKGYGEELFANRSQRVRRIFYNIYLYLIMITEDGPRQYDDKRSISWAKSQLEVAIGMLRLGNTSR